MATVSGGTVTVQSGDTLSKIAAQLGITDLSSFYAAMKTQLRSGNINLIYPGETLDVSQFVSGSDSGGGGGTETTTTTGDKVTPEQILELFALYGVDPSLHADGSTEDPQARARRIADEVNSGARTLASVTTAIANIAGAGSGTGIFGEPTTTGGTTIRSGGTLYRVRDEMSGQLTFHVVYEFEGVKISYSIGSAERFAELFPDGGLAAFNSIQSVSRSQFDELVQVQAGDVGEVLGTGESLGEELVNRMRAFGFESLPGWLRDDPAAMTIAATAAAEGWSAGRTLRQLSTTDGFRQRFGAWDYALRQTGGDEMAAMGFLTQRETELRQVIGAIRGPQTNTDPQYLQELISEGWTSESARLILSAERTFLSNPEMLTSLNTLLQADGMAPLTSDALIAMIAAGEAGIQDRVDFTDLLEGNDFNSVVDTINDAIVFTQLEQAGLRDLDIDFVRNLRNVTGGLLSEESVGQFVSQAASNVLRFIDDIDRERFGISEEEIISAAAGRPSPTGRSNAETAQILERIVRSRQAASQGRGGPEAFLNRRGSLSIAGIEGL